MTSPVIGHNSGLYVSDIGKLQAIDAVLRNPKFSQTEALILIGLIVRSDKTYANAFPGAGTLAVYAKVAQSDTVFKALRRLEDHFQMVKRASRGSGRSNSYAVLPQRVVDAIVTEYDAKKQNAAATPTHPVQQGAPIELPTLNRVASETHPVQQGGSEPKPTPFNRVGLNQNPPRSTGWLSQTHPVQQGATHPVEQGAYPFHDPNKKEEEGGGNKFLPFNWATALNPSSAEDAHDVCWRDDGTIEVNNGFKVELQASFPNVDLTSGLAIVAGEARTDEVGTDLKRRIRRKFGYLQNDEHGRDRRAVRVRASQTKPKPSRW
jgi:hypothetical protein